MEAILTVNDFQFNDYFLNSSAAFVNLVTWYNNVYLYDLEPIISDVVIKANGLIIQEIIYKEIKICLSSRNTQRFL